MIPILNQVKLWLSIRRDEVYARMTILQLVFGLIAVIGLALGTFFIINNNSTAYQVTSLIISVASIIVAIINPMESPIILELPDFGWNNTASSYVDFKDDALDKAIHKALGMQEDKPILLSTASNIEMTVLDLSKNTEPITDLKGISSFTNLKELYIPNSGITNISELKNLNHLEVLHLEGNSIKSLSPLKNLTNLEVLDLEGNEAPNISPLKKLTKLKILDVRNNGVKDIGVVKNMTNLEELYIGYNKIKSISPIENLQKLYYLSMGHNEVEDFRVLNSLPKLSKLSICYNPINTQFVIMGLTGLKHLRISDDQFTSQQIEELRNNISSFDIGD